MAWFFQQVVCLMIMTVKCCTASEECTLFVIVMTELFRWGCCGQEGNCDLPVIVIVWLFSADYLFKWSWLWNIVWPLYNVICLLLLLRNCLDRVVVAGEAIMIGLLMSWRHSRSKLSCLISWLWNVKIGTDFGKLWRKSLTRARCASLTRP